jgi:hypothetical protein
MEGMKRRANKTFGINQQRGFWLRCFLEQAESFERARLKPADSTGTRGGTAEAVPFQNKV